MKYVLIEAVVLAIMLMAALEIVGPAQEPLTELYFTNYTRLPVASSDDWPAPLTTFYKTDGQGRNYSVVISRTSGKIVFSEVYPWSKEVYKDQVLLKTFTGRILDGNGSTSAIYRITEISADPEQNKTMSYPFEFSIKNREGRDMSYTYEIIKTIDDVRTVQETANVLVLDGQELVLHSAVTANKPFKQMLVEVHLVGLPQTIHFWLNV